MNKVVIAACCVWVCRAARALRVSDTFAAVPLHPPLPVMHLLTAVPAAAPPQHQHQHHHHAPSPTHLTPYLVYYPKPPSPPPSRQSYSFSAYGDRVPIGKPTTLNEVVLPRYPGEVYQLSHAPSRVPSRYVDEMEEHQEEVEPLGAQYSATMVAESARPRPPARRRRPARPTRASPARSPLHATTEAPVIIRIHKYRIIKTNE